jgi:hypothetical protein
MRFLFNHGAVVSHQMFLKQEVKFQKVSPALNWGPKASIKPLEKEKPPSLEQIPSKIPEPVPGDRLEIYYNLHRKCLSARGLEGSYRGRVVARPKGILLKNVRFVVQPKGRERVLQEGRKNVHAFVRGILVQLNPSLNVLNQWFSKGLNQSKSQSEPVVKPEIGNKHEIGHKIDPLGWRKVTYNPYKYQSFVDAKTHQPIYQAELVYIQDKNIFVIQ